MAVAPVARSSKTPPGEVQRVRFSYTQRRKASCRERSAHPSDDNAQRYENLLFLL